MFKIIKTNLVMRKNLFFMLAITAMGFSTMAQKMTSIKTATRKELKEVVI